MSKNLRIKTSPTQTQPRLAGQQVVDAFDHIHLVDDTAVENAVLSLDIHIGNQATDKFELVSKIEAIPRLLEFLLSAVNDYSFVVIQDSLLQVFPTTPSQCDSSLAFQLLNRFSLAFIFVPYGDVPAEFTQYKRSIEKAASLLKALASSAFSDEAVEDDESVSPSSPTVRRAQRKWQQSRRASRASTRSSHSPVVEKTPFSDYGVSIPSSGVEATELSSKVLAEQKEILKFYLDKFREERYAAAFRAAYLPVPEAHAATYHHQAEPTTETQSAEPDKEPVTPAAYPLVQPMKAALYFDSADGFGAWRILISTRADRDLRRARNEDAKRFTIFVKKIKELSNGHFTEDNHKQLSGVGLAVPVYEAKMTRDTRLVYHIHCAPDFESNCERQVIRIFGIYTHRQIDGRFWDAMSRYLNYQGSEYRRRCVARQWLTNKRGDHVATPKEFPENYAQEEVVETPVVQEFSVDEMKQLHTLLSLEKFVTFSQALLNSIGADQEVAHVFNVSLAEKRIIEHSSSCFVQGRSGTGKTTTMLFKMLGIQRTWETFKDVMPKPRQIFVTQSRVLAERVEEYFQKLQRSLSAAQLSPKQLRESKPHPDTPARKVMLNADEEMYWRRDLPQRFGVLEEEHFPLFVSFDHLFRLLENEFRHTLDEADKEASISTLMKDLLHKPLRNTPTRAIGVVSSSGRESILDFDRFCKIYWAHFPSELVKGLNPDLVFSEFMGVIKGSEEAIKQQDGFLDRESYVVNYTRTGTSEGLRGAIYDLFEVYCKRKKTAGHRDVADRTRVLTRCLDFVGIPGRLLDFLYVDEAQDNLLIDALVLRKLCPNPHGMFWAGDTAQTISVGSAFRFNDLTALLYRKDQESASLGSIRARPEMFNLTTNYRSHSAIINCAHSIIDLITAYWPESIDALPREKGTTNGPMPIFFGDENSAEFDHSFFNDPESGDQIEFGAHQCILVRDDAARERLRNECGSVGHIFTLYESKGLEFDDVLLYNFFADSSMTYSQWRVVLNSIPRHKAPIFDEVRHSGICRELKCLYVAITRARMNLWIADFSKKAEPMRLLWEEGDLVSTHPPGTALPRLAVSSSKAEWAEAGHSLFAKGRYEEAMLDFQRAGLRQEKRVAYAFLLRERADALPLDHRGGAAGNAVRSEAFIKAADAFSASVPGALREEKRSYHRNAGECYERGGDNKRAAESYLDAEQYDLSAKLFRKAGLFDEALDVVKNHEDKMNESVVRSIVEVSKIQFLRQNKIGKAQSLFKDSDEALEFMEEHGFEAPRASLLEKEGRLSDAAESRLAEGDVFEAIRLFLRDQQRSGSVSRAVECLLQYLWRHISYGVAGSGVAGIFRESTTAESVFDFIEKLGKLCTNDDDRDEMAMFSAILRRQHLSLVEIGMRLSRSQNPRPRHAAVVLCLDIFFSEPFDLQSESPSHTAAVFEKFLLYARSLQRLSCLCDPCSALEMGKLFAFGASKDERISLSSTSYLVSQFRNDLLSSASDSPDTWSIPRWELETVIKNVLRKRLSEKVGEENEMCHNLQGLRPCLLSTIYHRCPKQRCSDYHVDVMGDVTKTYNTFVRIHMLQIMIFHTLYATDLPFERLESQQRAWLRRLYEALYPQHFRLGSIHALSPDLLPELSQGRLIIAVWVRDFLNRSLPHDKPMFAFLTNLMRATSLAMVFDHKAASTGLQTIPSYHVPPYNRPYHLVRQGVYVVHDLISSVQCNDVNSLNRGVLVLNHILSKRVSIDIGVLCDFMDYLCGAMVVAKRLQSRGNLHDITMPKSWIIRLVQDVEKIAHKDTELAVEYERHIGDLLEQVYSGADAGYLLSGRGRGNLSEEGFNITRNIYFSRICRNLCLWGYNRRSQKLREDIRRAICSIVKPGRQITSSLVTEYTGASDWKGLARAVRNSTSRSSLDEMIQLYHRSAPPDSHTPRNVRRVTFSQSQEILTLLHASQYLSSLRDETVDTADIRRWTLEGVDDDALGDEADDVDDRGVDVQGLTKKIDAEQPDISSAFTAAQLESAALIAAAFRRYLRRKLGPKDVMQETQRRFYANFRANYDPLKWGGSKYRFVYLGVGSVLAVAIECVWKHLGMAQEAAKMRLRTVEHEDLEVAEELLGRMSRLFDRSCQLRIALSATGPTHTSGDIQTLVGHVRAIKLLIDEIMDHGGTGDWEKLSFSVPSSHASTVLKGIRRDVEYVLEVL